MRLAVTVGGGSRAPLLAGTEITKEIGRSRASLSFVGQDGIRLGTGQIGVTKFGFDVGLLSEIIVTEAGENLHLESPLPGAWLPGSGTITSDSPTIHFRGFVTNIRRSPGQYAPGHWQIFADCQDYSFLTTVSTVSIDFSAGMTDAAILQQLIVAAGLGTRIDATTAVSTITASMPAMEFSNEPLRGAIDKVAQVTGGIWRINEAAQLVYNAHESATASALNITTAKREGLSIEEEFDGTANHVTVKGSWDSSGNLVSQTASDATSIAKYGLLKRTIVDSSIKSSGRALAVATSLVALGSFPRYTVSLKSFEDGWEPNTITTVTLPTFNLQAQSLLVRSVRIRQLTGELTEYSLRLGDPRPTVDDVLRDLKSAPVEHYGPPQATPPVGSITETTISDGAISTPKLAANAVTAAKIFAGTITANEIANSTITGGKIAGTTITDSNIVNSTITGAKIASATIEAANIVNATITGAKIASATITDANIATATITSAKIASLAANKISAGTITSVNISAGTYSLTSGSNQMTIDGTDGFAQFSSASNELTKIFNGKIFVENTTSSSFVTTISPSVVLLEASGGRQIQLKADSSPPTIFINGQQVLTQRQADPGAGITLADVRTILKAHGLID